MNKKRPVIIYLLAAVFVVALGRCKTLFQSNPINIQHPKQTYATFTRTYIPGGIPTGSQECMEYVYKVNGVNYSKCPEIWLHPIKNEKCIVIYDSLNPVNAIIYQELKIFLVNEKRSKHFGIAYSFVNYKAEKFKGLNYYYVLNDKKYYGGTLIKDTSDINKYRIGDTVQIVYSLENPERSIAILHERDLQRLILKP